MVYSLFIRMSKKNALVETKREWEKLSPLARDSTSKFLFFGRAKLYLLRAREKKSRRKWFFDTNVFFFRKPNHRLRDARERERARAKETFATKRSIAFGRVVCFDGVRESARRVTSRRHMAKHGPTNHLIALRFRCWMCESRYETRVVVNKICQQWPHKYLRASCWQVWRRRFSVKNQRFGSRFNRNSKFNGSVKVQQYLRASALVDDENWNNRNHTLTHTFHREKNSGSNAVKPILLRIANKWSTSNESRSSAVLFTGRGYCLLS